MAAKFCAHWLEELIQVVRYNRHFMVALCVSNLVFSLVATLGNLLVIRALWNASSISATMKKLFLSLAFSDLAVGLFAQLMFGVIIALMSRQAATGNYNFDFLCPTILTVYYFSLLLLGSASFLNVTAIAVDRLLAVSLHLRYQELVTSKRVITALVSLWLTSGVVASIFITLPDHSHMIAAITAFLGLFLTTVAYLRIYKVVRHHQNQIHHQLQLPDAQAPELLREKKSAFNSLFVYVVFLVCFLPHLCSLMFLINNSLEISLLLVEQVSRFLVFLNSSLNPLVYCWRYREIREIVKNTVKKIFRINDTGT